MRRLTVLSLPLVSIPWSSTCTALTSPRSMIVLMPRHLTDRLIVKSLQEVLHISIHSLPFGQVSMVEPDISNRIMKTLIDLLRAVLSTSHLIIEIHRYIESVVLNISTNFITIHRYISRVILNIKIIEIHGYILRGTLSIAT